MIVAILAVFRAGAAYLPIDPAYPADRVGFMLADTRAALVLGTAELLDDLPVGHLRTFAVDDPVDAARIAACPADTPRTPVSPDGLAYVIYTSGSTGRPKGVAVTHGGLANYVLAAADRLGCGQPVGMPCCRARQRTWATRCCSPALVSGGRLHVLPADAATDPAMVSACVTEHEIDYLKVVPSHLAALGNGVLPGRAWCWVVRPRRPDGHVRCWRRPGTGPCSTTTARPRPRSALPPLG